MPAHEADYYRLRTEWLRFKSHLYDGLTGLPSLAAVVEDVRRILETAGSAEVLYLDLGRSGWHETKLGWAAYDEAIRAFAEALGGLRGTEVLSERDLVCLHTVRSDRFLVFLVPHGEQPGSRREALLGAIRERVIRPDAYDGRLRSVQLSAGHALIREDPMIRSERSIQQAVTEAVLSSLVQREGSEENRRNELARMIRAGAVRSVFHPIVSLRDGTIVGHEALTRPLGQVPFESVEELFAFAESTELLVDFERLCRATAIRSVSRVPRRGLLFLNASAQAVEDPEWGSGAVETLLRQSGLTPKDVVVEITERVAIARREAFQSALRTFKERGYGVAVDDMGAGYASLQSLAAIEPEFLKFDVSLVRDIDRSSIKRSLLESLRALAGKINARVIAEGVEREEERVTLLALGIELGQGFLFHREETP